VKVFCDCYSVFIAVCVVMLAVSRENWVN